MSLPRIVAIVFALAVLFSTLYLFFRNCLDEIAVHLRPQVIRSRACSLVMFAITFSVIGEFLTLVGMRTASPLCISDWSFRRIAFLFVFGLLIYATFRAVVPARFAAVEHAEPECSVDTRMRLSLLVISCGSAAMVLAYTLFYYCFAIVAPIQMFALYCAISIVCFIVLFRCDALSAVSVFALSALSVGLFFSLCVPPAVGFSYDDETHFDRSLGISFIGSSELTDAEVEMVAKPWNTTGSVDRSILESSLTRLDNEYQNATNAGAIRKHPGWTSPVLGQDLISISMVGNIPSAIGIWFGRLLHLPLTGLIVAGRLANLLSYVVVVCFAIRLAPSKKWCFACVGLFPTSLFMASSFSYDPWIVSVVMLATAMMMKFIASEQKATVRNIIPCLIVLALGLASKAIYFPLVGLLLFVSKDRFDSPLERRRYYAAILLFVCAMVVSFVLPLLFTQGGQAGDSRGGSAVSSIGQIRYFFSNPIGFISTLSVFVSSYVSPFSAGGYTLATAYLGSVETFSPNLSVVAILCYALAATFDPDASGGHHLGLVGGIGVVALVMATVFLVVASLYVSYTPVAYGTVNGCQPRYLLPLLAPLSLAVSIKWQPDRAFVLAIARAVTMCVWLLGLVVCAYVAPQL